MNINQTPKMYKAKDATVITAVNADGVPVPFTVTLPACKGESQHTNLCLGPGVVCYLAADQPLKLVETPADTFYDIHGEN
ncbi:hypothetical protein M2371_004294 [Buttiauxella sp. BIGb0471]|uniref:hypothetical protein n=1 Tax=Buttiauxella sp. BIGb0471 TaxID=2940597 RepID=UPI0021699D6D|nr:hypothetical protein [Buttiauxella sp. BIGb0471]MCS3605040.1 hypothetical protein [Buttiauxella sp. BIGb0471]